MFSTKAWLKCRRLEPSMMTRLEMSLVIVATFLMVAIVISYVCRGGHQASPGGAAETSPADRERVFRPPDVVAPIADDDYESWRPPVLPSRLKSAQQDDQELIEHIRSSWILPPPARSPRRLNHPEKYDHSEYGQSFVIDKLLHGLDHGIYVDVWAGNGETDSNTLFLEKDRHWDGLLVEPNPDHFRSLIGKRRHAYAVNACVSPTTTPSVLNLTYGGSERSGSRSAFVQCFPLYSLIRALDIRRVDYLSIRSQLELEILKTLPLQDPDKLTVVTLTVETHINRNRRQTLATNEEVKILMTSYGYRWVDAGERINKRNVILQRKNTLTK
ncbi:hypothetical protein LSH36_629g01023 [Paralvinella palmiformis]|uniref:Methyltransferase FkbM domain-containing protein n=1 Tax=Paralvinella palmiformis TaxID=53620 RepID=A0AAD9J3T2_9ANNE|nr:hypothetical protein LSH36_629g01023 [Paralvinella palmiformis]